LTRIVASAPGKLVLLGEYAVLEGAPALVLAVDRRASATIESGKSLNIPTNRHPGIAKRYPGPSAFASQWIAQKSLGPGFRRDDEQNQSFPDGDKSWEIVSPTLQLQARLRLQNGHATWIDKAPAELEWITTLLARFPQAERLPACRIELDSDAFYLGHDGARAKLGLGSSAALAVALLGALHAHANLAPPTLHQAIVAHRAIQHGRGSGIDIAASLSGGLSRFQLDGDAMRLAPMKLPDGLAWCCVYSGRPASTRAMLTTVADWREREPAAFAQRTRELATISSRGIDAVIANDAAAFMSSLHDYAGALARFGEAAGADIASREHRAIAAIATDCGCVYKSCGAGGGDVGVTFAVEDTRLRAFAGRVAQAGYPVIDLAEDPKGLAVASND
jgi:phosphomevalonate kinase